MAGSSSYLVKPGQVERKWYVIDAADRPVGRLASAIARILTGKNKPTYTPHVDTGDYVVVINAEKVKMTGKKATQSKWHYHTGHPGGYRAIPWARLVVEKPEFLLEHVVRGMLPRNRLKYASKLKVYAGPSHPHAAQAPETLDV
ncbi:50S ribosomal protein L13 [Fretibacterium fastidiosum]|uniref:Large ribosomal subunit protein uL13 n=1 Tax=Fretibacterium fastidiosum TaxID=651822 RepID=A0AB94IY72_9BACT|nr:50S ribosomal protein L13 [Fretibacterium fastidiosum]CBL28695.1 LSU ribosomal protein L13P [Fretibacterium fastidiosum]